MSSNNKIETEVTPELFKKLTYQYVDSNCRYIDAMSVIFPFDNKVWKHENFIFGKLILKEIKNITDADALEVSKAGLPKKYQNHLWCATSGKDMAKIIENKKCWSFYYKEADWFAVKQKLIDLGYDVFFPQLKNKTMIEAGLAISESEFQK